MTVAALDVSIGARTAETPLIDSRERFTLAVRLTLSMIAAGLLVIAVAWRLLLPAEAYLADLIAGAAAFLVAIPVITAAWKSLREPSLHGVTDQLVALSLIAAWATGELMTAALLPIVMILGHVLEERSLIGSRESINALGKLVEGTARRLRADGRVERIAVDRIAAGDRIELWAGDRVPADGVILEGRSSLDTASLTGESVPVDVAEGAPALAGSINLDGKIVIEVSRVGGETTLGQVISLMKSAEAAKPPITRLIEQYAGQYIVLILLIAAGVWFATGDKQAMLAVLVASCPCALVLAAPATAIAAIAVAARHGILIKGTAFLEQLAAVTSVVLDKTGTVTKGQLSLISALPAPGEDPDRMIRLAAALGANSTHPVSRAVAARLDLLQSLPLEDIREERGLGIQARLGTDIVALGRPELMAELGAEAGDAPLHDGPIAALCRGQHFMGWLLFADEPRPEAKGALEGLRGLGLTRQVLLTGDRNSVARRIGAYLGIEDVCAEVLPEQKMARVLKEIADGYKPLVVGDGINDALALKAGAVGIAMGIDGTDVARASADLVLITSDLRRLATCIRLSRRCRTTIHVNVALGLGWTVALVAAAAAGWLGSSGPILAALLHNFGTLAGLANAARLLRFDETQSPPVAA